MLFMSIWVIGDLGQTAVSFNSIFKFLRFFGNLHGKALQRSMLNKQNQQLTHVR